MWRYAARVIAFFCGWLILFVALLLDSKEQNSLAARLNHLWHRLRTMQQAALSRHTFFLQQVAFITNHGIERLFGPRILSLHTLCVSICLSQVAIAMVSIANTFNQYGVLQWGLSGTDQGFLAAIVLWTALGIMPAVSRKARHLPKIGLIITVITCVLAFQKRWADLVFVRHVALATMAAPLIRGLHGEFILDADTFAIPILIFSAVGDFASIAVGRCLLKCAADEHNVNSIGLVIGPLFGTLLLPSVLCASPYFYAITHIKTLPLNTVAFIAAVAASNIFGFIISLCFLVLAVTALAHRLIWPLLWRPAMAAWRYNIFTEQRMLAVIGVSLLAISSPFGRWLESLLSRFHLLK